MAQPKFRFCVDEFKLSLLELELQLANSVDIPPADEKLVIAISVWISMLERPLTQVCCIQKVTSIPFYSMLLGVLKSHFQDPIKRFISRSA